MTRLTVWLIIALVVGAWGKYAITITELGPVRNRLAQAIAFGVT